MPDYTAMLEAAMRLRTHADFILLAPIVNEWMVFKNAEVCGTIPPLEELRRIHGGPTINTGREG